jgi:cysteine desulfurase
MKPVYLDYNATTPIDPRAAAAMRPFLDEYFGNPSSGYAYGRQSKEAVEKARRQVARLLGCRPDEVTFTSGGTESNNYAIKGIAMARRDQGQHIITSAVEHPAVTEVCRFLEAQGFAVTSVPVDRTGRVDPEDVRKAVTPKTILISLMHANNEVGTIQPVRAVSDIAREHGIPIHTDAAQSAGKIPVNVDELGVDLLSLAGHKLYAPKGIGALYIRRGTLLERLIHGADQEAGRRAGTENILEIVGLGAACEIAGQDPEAGAAHLKKMRDRLYRGLMDGGGEMFLNGHPEHRLPNTLSAAFPGIPASVLLEDIQDRVAASAGSACHSDRVALSPVLAAMGVPEQIALGTVRLSTGRPTREADIDRAVSAILEGVDRARKKAHLE